MSKHACDMGIPKKINNKKVLFKRFSTHLLFTAWRLRISLTQNTYYTQNEQTTMLAQCANYLRHAIVIHTKTNT